MVGQDMIRQLTAELEAANERAKAAEAEIAYWRRAVRWETVHTENHYHLKVGGVTVGVVLFVDRWSAMTMGVHYLELPDRDAACTRVCELLGIPVVLPVGG